MQKNLYDQQVIPEENKKETWILRFWTSLFSDLTTLKVIKEHIDSLFKDLSIEEEKSISLAQWQLKQSFQSFDTKVQYKT